MNIKKKLSEARLKRKEKLGYLISKESKEKMSLSRKGKSFTDEHKEKIRIALKGRKPSEKCNENKMKAITGIKRTAISIKRQSETARSKKRTGEKSHNWKGGKSIFVDLIRKSAKYKEWRQNIFIRDSFTCQKCNDNSGGNLNAHHIKRFMILLKESLVYLPHYKDYDAAMAYSPLWNTDNGITLCENCHKKEKRNG